MDSSTLTIGIEEEYLLLDPTTGQPTPAGERVRRIATGGDAEDAQIEPELLQVQVEVATPVCTSVAEAGSHLRKLRRELADAGEQAGCVVVAVAAASSFANELPPASEKDRYQRMHARAPRLVDEMLVNGMHVHVGVPDPGERARLLNQLRPWLPVLVALAANSPFWDGTDSGFASWRTVHFNRWPASGPPPHVADEADYERRVEAILETGALVDRGQLYWQARLSQTYPTVEIRVADVQLTVDDALLIAGMLRGLAAHLLAAPDAEPVPDELLRAAVWQAARDGSMATLLHPVDRTVQPAQAVLDALFDAALPELDALGDGELVRMLLARRTEIGSGARRQRDRYQRAGLAGVLDLLHESFVAESALADSTPTE